jgi:alpha-glucuronidase
MRPRLLLLVLASFALSAAHAETGAEGWLRYAPVTDPAALQSYKSLPHRIVQTNRTPVAQNAAAELARGLSGELGLQVQQADTLGTEDAFVLATPEELKTLLPDDPQRTQPHEGFQIAREHQHNRTLWIIAGGTPSAELFAVFHLLQGIATQSPQLEASESPSVPVRWVNQWDNLDGSIERGYAGRSIFFDAGHVRADLTRASDYARLLASIGINGCTVNNVNSDLRTLTPEMLHEFARIADAFRPWGIRLSLSVDLSSPLQIDIPSIGHLTTFDPLDPTVATWWQQKVDEIYTLIPDFGGFVIKADSEGRVGPSQYHRTPAEAANTVARALKPHGGIVLYRGFVYNNHLDYNDLKADRARAGYDNFYALDGKFESNVVIQVKHGPIDFQVREPVSPLFAALQHTSQAIELQITQEYTGQQRHMVFLVPMWKTALDTDLRAPASDGTPRSTPVKEIIEGKSFHQPLGGFVGVANVGLDTNWLHHPMAMANLYGYGRLAWNPDLTTQQIIDTWTRLTFGNDPKVVATIDDLQSNSWHVYEQYTGNLGIGTLTNILGYHYGPGIESAERNGWGQWFRADSQAIGMDRTVATGTGYIGQYPPELARTYENVATCPDDLLLFMHHVPYTYVLHDGKTVVQHVYDAHYEGAATAQTYAPRWQTLKGLVDDDRYNETLKLFTYQAGHAIVWRDAVTRWFQKESSIPDKLGRVGNYPNRIEAESMTAEGYTPIDVKPWETGSNSKAAVCNQPTGCTLTTTLNKPAGTYNIIVQYFDFWSGKSHFTLDLNHQPIGNWIADDTLPPARAENQHNGDTSTRITFPNIPLKPGDTLTLHGTPDNTEPGPVDYIEITKPTSQVTVR